MDRKMENKILGRAFEFAFDKILEAEKQMDEAIEHFDSLDQGEIDDLRKRRRQQLLTQKKQKEDWLAKGHGTYLELHDQKEWFDTVKTHSRVVTHFFRPTTEYCQLLDEHLAKLAASHVETKFVKINAETTPYICETLEITVMPTVIMTHNRKVIDCLEGFTELGNTPLFTTQMLETRLSQKGAIIYDEEHAKYQAEQQRLRAAQQQQQVAIRQSSYSNAIADLDDEDPWLSE